MKNAGYVKTIVIAAIAGAVLFAPAAAQAVVPNPNPWLTMRFLNIAHQGGEDEAPSNTLFAHKSAVLERGADSIELDVNLSMDGQLMVIHDDTVTGTTESTALREDMPSSEVDRLTAAQIQALDAGYRFQEPAGVFPYRGIRTGAEPPPAGYTADDFRIPTLPEVLNAFPNTPINIEIKMEKNVGGANGGCVTQNAMQYCDDAAGSNPTAVALADLLDQPAYEGRQDIIVVSFADSLVEEFHNNDTPPWTPLAPALGDATGYAFSGTTPSPDVAAFQIPPRIRLSPPPAPSLEVASLFLGPNGNSHEDGYAVHVWPNGEEPESEASYARMVGLGADGYMASEPLRLHNYLCTAGVRRPDGSARCPAQIPPPTVQPSVSTPPAAQKKCKKGQKLKKGKCVKAKKKKKKKGKKK